STARLSIVYSPRPARSVPKVEAIASVLVISLPTRIGSFEYEVRGPTIVPDDEKNMAGSSGVLTHQLGKVDASGRVRRHSPGSGHSPVSVIHEPGCAIGYGS